MSVMLTSAASKTRSTNAVKSLFPEVREDERPLEVVGRPRA